MTEKEVNIETTHQEDIVEQDSVIEVYPVDIDITQPILYKLQKLLCFIGLFLMGGYILSIFYP